MKELNCGSQKCEILTCEKTVCQTWRCSHWRAPRAYYCESRPCDIAEVSGKFLPLCQVCPVAADLTAKHPVYTGQTVQEVRHLEWCLALGNCHYESSITLNGEVFLVVDDLSDKVGELWTLRGGKRYAVFFRGISLLTDDDERRYQGLLLPSGVSPKQALLRKLC